MRQFAALSLVVAFILALSCSVISVDTILGIHSPDFSDAGLSNLKNNVFAGKNGWVLDVVYSTDFDWIAGAAANFERTARYGLTPIVRFDYARPDGSAWANNADTFGANIPMSGTVGWCLQRKNGVSRQVRDSTHLGCYLQYIQDFVSATPNVHHWIIGNEMNMGLEAKGFPNGRIAAAWYAQVYRAARTEIRRMSGHQNDIVMIGAVAPGDGNAPRWYDGDAYLNLVLSNLKTNEVDGISLHAYGGWPQNDPQVSMNIFKPTYTKSLAVIDRRGFRNTPVWITEFSSHSDAAREAGSARFIKDAVTDVRQWSWGGNHPVSGMIWFVWDHPGFTTESINRFSKVKSAFTNLARQGF